MKVIRPELAADPGFRARFKSEVAAARKVNGLFTAMVVDADAEGPVPWLATAYVAGPTLGRAVDERGPLPYSVVLKLAAGLAESLAAIHAAGVVHRDLKSWNVVLADDGPRVIDFGISRALEGASLTGPGFVMGTPGHLPQQAEGNEVGAPYPRPACLQAALVRPAQAAPGHRLVAPPCGPPGRGNLNRGGRMELHRCRAASGARAAAGPARRAVRHRRPGIFTSRAVSPLVTIGG